MAVVAVVKYNGGPDALAWRFPSEGIGTWTQLIVNESQEAILFAGGQSQDIFSPGQYELSTDKIPLLNAHLNLPAGKRSPLAVDIWYINKERSLVVKWGTPAPVELLDSKYNALIPIKALGQFSVQIGESTSFLNNLTGTLQTFDNDSLIKYLRSLQLSMLGENILSYIEDKDISVLEISSHLNELSEHLKNKMLPVLDGLSVKMNDFRLNQIKLSEDSPVVKQINEALAKKNEALAKQAVIDLVGSEYVKEEPIEIQVPSVTATEYIRPNPIQPDTAVGAGFGLPNDLTGQPITVPAPIPVPVIEAVQTEAESDMVISVSEQAIEDEFNNVAIIKTCPVCYYDLDPVSQVCAECGYGTKEESQEATVSGEIEQRETEQENMVTTEPTISKRCPTCSSDMDVVARFCSVCGYDTNEAEVKAVNPEDVVSKSPVLSPTKPKYSLEKEKSVVRKCGSCGTQLRNSQKFCHKCGSIV